MDRKRTWMLAVALLLVPSLGLAQTDWVDDPGDPVIGPPDPGAWDAGYRYPLAVIEVNGTYHMYFNGRAVDSGEFDDYDIGHATSPDGVSWEMDPANPVLVRGADGEWDDTALWGVAVIHDDSGFRMWYSGNDGEVARTGYATSPDGSTWAKHAGNPIIDVGPPGSFDDEGVIPRTVIVEDGLYRMWYFAIAEFTPMAGVDWRIGYAESADGLSWTRHPAPVLDPGEGWDDLLVYAPSVVFDGAKYHMWYTGSSGSRVATGYAVSSDGIEWTRYHGNPVVDLPGTTGCDWPNVHFDDDGGLFVMWYHDLDANTIRRATSACCSTLYLSLIPAAAFASGAEGSFYSTDLDVSNAGSAAAEYRFGWLPRGQSNEEWVWSELFSLGSGMSVRYGNVLAEVFGLEPDAFGALVIEASSRDVLAMARIANTFETKATGSYGQAMPALRLDEFLVAGERRRILFGTEHADMRTNVGCMNASDRSTVVNLDLIAADGTVLETKSMILRAWGNDQINRIFRDYRPTTGCVDVWSDVANSRLYCYGSVLDNTTSDPTTIPPK